MLGAASTYRRGRTMFWQSPCDARRKAREVLGAAAAAMEAWCAVARSREADEARPRNYAPVYGG